MLLKNLDIYCERLSSNFWAEPVNALTNICIFTAGFLGYLAIRQTDKSSAKTQASMAAIMAMVTGVGSFCFHTFANVLTMWMDIIPITFFQIFSVNFYLQFIFKRKMIFRVLFLSIFVFSSLFLQSERFSSYFNGSMMYFPSILTLISFGILCFRMKLKEVGKYTLTGVGFFLISIFFRSIDMQVCNEFPLGTHFLWHSLNGVLIFCLLKALVSFLVLPKNKGL